MKPRVPDGIQLFIKNLDAVIFDTDGVVTRTTELHAAAWKQVFDAFLDARTGKSFVPFDVERDYLPYVDGRPRYEGVVAFLASRGITLPYGDPDDLPGGETVCALGNRKDAYFRQEVERRGVAVFDSTLELIRKLRGAGLKTGVFSASQNANATLVAAGAMGFFDAKVDGTDAAALGLRGKPDPAMLLELARRLGVAPGRTAVVEDAIAGVPAGREGGFAVIIGVNRSMAPGRLLDCGADVEVVDLKDVSLST